MEIKNYLIPAEIDVQSYEQYQWGSTIRRFTTEHFPKLDGVQAVIIGIGESRNSMGNDGCMGAPDNVRAHFYKLSSVAGIMVADIGNLIPGQTPKDTYHAVEFVCSELLDKKIIPIIIGGSQDLTFANYLAYQKQQQTVNLVCIDRKVDLGVSEDTIDSNSYLSNIIQHGSGLLFNLSLVAYQSHFINTEEIETLQKMYFDVYRLGHIQAKLEEAEPVVRSADILSFDISAIRQSDAPACAFTTPNGLYGEEACQIMRYAGMSDKLSSVGIYELNPLFDNRGQTAHLAAQMIWYFLEGFSNRKNDFPVVAGKDYMKYRVAIKAPEHEIVFYKSLKTDRWWMEVPFKVDDKSRFERHHLVPCSYEDYLLACSEEMPDRWWQAYQKLN
ncbi:MAG TPA: formimidoylglutamase [Bacteroidia bacterium]|nr:formimidoylglutamase [Bacteroidia bacterium]